MPRQVELESPRSPAEIVARLEARAGPWAWSPLRPLGRRVGRVPGGPPRVAFRAWPDGRFRLVVAFGRRNGWRRECAGRLTPLPGGGGTRVAARFVGLPVWALPAAGAALVLAAAASRAAHGQWASAAFGLGVGAPLLAGVGWALDAVGRRNVDRDDAFLAAVLAEAAGAQPPAA